MQSGVRPLRNWRLTIRNWESEPARGGLRRVLRLECSVSFGTPKPPDVLALTGLFRARWSAAVHEEWISNLLEKRPDLTNEKLERTRMLMDRHAADALVTGYEDLIPGLHLPDPNDRHVVAAAIRGRVDVIVTMNLKDFPAEVIAL
jgi:hypothetical protein